MRLSRLGLGKSTLVKLFSTLALSPFLAGKRIEELASPKECLFNLAELSFVAQYNPFFGDVAVEVVEKALAGESVENPLIVESETFDSPEAAQAALDAGKGF